jgi:cell division protein FtsL
VPNLPGWDSLAAVTKYHNFAELIGIVILGLLVAAEVITYKYNGRRDFLAEKAKIAADQSHEEEMARLRRETAALTATAEKYRAAIADADARAAEANNHAKQLTLELAKLQTPRTLRPEQQQEIVRLLKDAPKGPISVSSPFTDSTDAGPFAASIKEALTKAGYTIVDPPSSLKSIMNWDRPGAWLLVHSLTQRAPPYGPAIQRAFAAIGIYLEGIAKPDDVPEGVLVIAVSSHPLKSEPIPSQLLNFAPK